MTTFRHDVVVAGGGMVGAAAVLALRQAGIDCGLIEPQAPPVWDAQTIDLRVSAISPASENLLHSLGLWQQIESRRVSPFESMHVWEQPGRDSLNFSAAEFASHRLGHIVENNLLVQALREKTADAAVYQSALQSMDSVDDGLWLRLADGREIKTRLLIGADGIHSHVRELSGLVMQGSGYQQRGLVCHVQSEAAHEKTAWQRFLPGGPLALLPLDDGRCSIVWSLATAEAEHLQAMDDESFSAALSQAFGEHLGSIRATTQRVSFPLAHRHADRYRSDRVALIGDAAHVVHPLAGQGGNLGMLDAATLAEEIVHASNRGVDPGHDSVLARYERRRRADNMAMLSATDALQRMFASDSPWMEGIRRIGMGMVDRLHPVKNALIRHAMYGPPNAPALMRKEISGFELD